MVNGMNIILKFYVPALSVLGALLFAASVLLGIDGEMAVLAISVFALGSAYFLERAAPFRASWSKNRGDLSVDLVSAGILIALVDPLLKIAAPLLIVWVYASFALDSPMGHALPLWAEISLVLVLVEFGKYWAHRLHHTFGPVWWLHAMHHSSERLYVLNGLRFHPLNYVINFSVSFVPVMLLGASPEAILGYLAISQPVVLVQHANINLRHGFMNAIFSTPEAHRWHHSTISSEANRNYGNAFLIWDHVFGTYRPADGFSTDKVVGLFESSRKYPSYRGYLCQVASMFKPPCCVA